MFHIISTFLFFFLIYAYPFSSFSELNSTSESKFHMCFFDLSGDFAQEQFEKQGEKNFQSTSFFSAKSNISAGKAFKKMVESKTKCDGLIISGHHTGTFYGDKTGNSSALTLYTLEKLSCSKEGQNFFKNIKSLWLLGCRTANNNYLKGTSAHITGDKKAIKFAEKNKNILKMISNDYSHTLDKNTTITSRYLRMFPNTQVYGFDGSAPTEKNIKNTSSKKKNDEKYFSDIYNHIHKLGKAINQEMEGIKKIKETEDKTIIARGIQAISNPDLCNALKRNIWNNQLNSRSAIGRDGEKDLYEKARELGCRLINAELVLDDREKDSKEKENAKEEIIKVLKEIQRESQSAELFDLLFHNILEAHNSLRDHDDARFLPDMLIALNEIPAFRESMKDRIKSNIFPTIKKIDILKMYQKIYVEKEYITESVKNIIEDLSKNKNFFSDKEIFKVFSDTVIDQLKEYQLLDNNHISHLKNSNLIDGDHAKKLKNLVNKN